MNTQAESVFQAAARVFDGWTDPETGLRVLRIIPRNNPPGSANIPWYTVYHQNPCFLDNGRSVLLRQTARGAGTHLLDLASGELRECQPTGWRTLEVCDRARTVLAFGQVNEISTLVLRRVDTGEEIARFSRPGALLWSGKILSDGLRFIAGVYRGKFYDEYCHSEFFLVDGNEAKLILDADGFFCNHIMPCPVDPNLYAYDRWPSPKYPIEVVLRVRNLDGSFDEPLPQLLATMRPGLLWGSQRDHYLWSPDGRRILSYFARRMGSAGDHFDFGWWVSAMDWRTGEDFSAEYPPDRWGCNFGVSPDSRFIVSAGGRKFQKIYRVDIGKLRNGWNERVLCSYPHSEEDGMNNGPFHMPFVLPDQSGVIFSAGFGGSESGVFLVEWPRE